MLDKISAIFDKFFALHAYTILGGAIFMFLAVMFAYWVGRMTRYVMAEKMDIDPAVVRIAVRTFRIAIVLLSAISVLDEFGIHFTGLLAAMGIFGFALAIGLRTTTTNIFTGMMLSALKPFEVGDQIEGERIEGVVESMHIFHTVVVTGDGTYVSVPNGPMWAKSIKNLSRPRPRRLDFAISIDRKPDAQDKNQLSFDELRPVIDEILRTDRDRYVRFQPLIAIEDMTDSLLKIRASVWCKIDMSWDARERLVGALKDGLTQVGAPVTEVAPAKKKAPPRKRPAAADPPNDDVL